MGDSSATDPFDHILDLLGDDSPEAANERVATLQSQPADDRKAAIRSLQSVAEDRPTFLGPIAPAIAEFLDDEERSVRLGTAKLLVAIAEADSAAVKPVVPPLADRLADDEAFYYVRARAAEALGYVAVEYPDAVTAPEILADLRIGLEFDEPETREKLAKALEHVALGDPSRLRHQVDRLGDHLDDEPELVRYHLTTALVVIGTAHPEALSPAEHPLRERLDDEVSQIRGRAASALGLLAAADGTVEDGSLREKLQSLADAATAFEAERARFALGVLGSESGTARVVPTIDETYDGTADAVADIRAPDDDGQCPHCGLEFPENGPPMCPRCGGPY
ncbi:HEAT repeat domain-containing protein [Halapricum salinum]|uniref:HEAT repeat domain-containing protein n=1 Tax=Halapricum salinum TaxID=1457250 RepID=A0A4D6HD89_9EURY|nr:HEAT repeat domain-containing protein [Halapricum salinum]QCC52044.1 hypothetical protein DV733_12775 [Halapricum salinum]